MRRTSFLLSAVLALGLVGSACASDIDPALRVADTELSRDDLEDLAEEAVELQDVFIAERGGGGAGLPLIGTPPSELAGSESAALVEGVLTLVILDELVDEVYEARGVDPDGADRDEIAAELDDAIFVSFGLDDELDSGLGLRLRNFFVDREVLGRSLGVFTPSDAELAALADAVGVPVDDPAFLSGVEATIANGPLAAALIFASLTIDVDVDPRYGEWDPLGLQVLSRGESVGYPPGFEPAVG